jgi:hypothetical protein
MSSSPPLPAQPFQPQFLTTDEFIDYGLPDPTQQSDIVALVQRASTLIDEFCARTDVDGQGSLVYSTYTERLFLPVGRNIFRVSFRPLAVVDVATVNQLAASGNQGLEDTNYFYTGCLPNTLSTQYPQNTVGGSTLTPLLSASGRYGYARRGQQQVYPDLNYAANILQIASFFGGPPQFTNIDVTMVDVDARTGECWVPAGLYLSQYTEVLITYNSGFHPLRLPNAIKHATASLVRNLLSRGGGATGLTSFRAGQISAGFTDDLIDVNIQNMLQAYRTVRTG